MSKVATWRKSLTVNSLKSLEEAFVPSQICPIFWLKMVIELIHTMKISSSKLKKQLTFDTISIILKTKLKSTSKCYKSIWQWEILLKLKLHLMKIQLVAKSFNSFKCVAHINEISIIWVYFKVLVSIFYFQND